MLSTSSTADSEFVFDFCCTVCQEDGRYLEAVGFCSDCMDYLCQNCYGSHCRPRPMRHHTLRDKASMPKRNDAARKTNRHPADICTDVCPRHFNKVLEYYCASHEVLGCSVCLMMHHRNCTRLTYIPDVAGYVCDSEEFKQITKELKTMADCSRRIIDVAKDNTSMSKTFHSETLQALKDFRMEINAILDKLEDGIKDQADKIKSKDINNLTMTNGDCKRVLNEINCISSRLATLQQDKKYCMLFVTLKTAKPMLLAMKTTLDQANKDVNIQCYKFYPGEQLKQFLQDPTVLGKLSITDHVDQCNTLSSGISTVACKPAVNPKRHVNVRMQNVGCINVRVHGNDSSPCWITGSALLTDDKLVVTDFAVSNKTVNLVDTHTNTLISYIKLSSQPWDITTVTREQLAVTLPKVHKILFISLTKEKQLVEGRTIQVNGTCYGIVYARDMLIVSFEKPGKVEILTMNGVIQGSISTDNSGRPLFTWPWYMALSHERNTLYVSDFYNDTVTRLSLTGQVMAIYKDALLRGPRGIVTDSKGRVFVCGWGSNNVHVLSAQCEKIQVTLPTKEGLYTLSYSENTSMLFVGQLSDDLKVYQIT